MVDRADLQQMLDSMVRGGGTTLHLTADAPPSVRLQGRLIRSQDGDVASNDIWNLIDDIVTPEQRQQLEAGGEVRGLFVSDSGVCFRNALMLDQGGPNMVFRRLPARVPSLDELNLPEVLASFTQFNSGLVLVTGFMGSGKSATLAALVDRVNQSAVSHIVTIEQPIEYLHESNQTMLHQREVGRHVHGFADGVREAVQQSADVIMVADLPDAETVDAVLNATERGCLVFAGLRANSVVGAIETLFAMNRDAGHRFSGRFVESLRALTAQTLLFHGHSRDRVPLLEIAINNQAVRRAILSQSLEELSAIMDRARGLGMQTADRGLKDLLSLKLITQDEALYHALDRDWLFKRGG